MTRVINTAVKQSFTENRKYIISDPLVALKTSNFCFSQSDDFTKHNYDSSEQISIFYNQDTHYGYFQRWQH